MLRSHVRVSIIIFLMALAVFSLALLDAARADVTPLGRFRAYEVTCTSTGAPLAPPALQGAPHRFQSFEMTNGATEIFLGGSNVNDTGGVGKSLAASATKAIDGDPAALWCITASGSSVVTILAGQK